MKIALFEAQKGFDIGEVPVGAALVDLSTKKIIAQAHNMVESLQNPLMHAEMLVLQRGFEVVQSKFLNNFALYVTLEPCCMCSTAISYARISVLYYGAEDHKFGAVSNNIRYFNSACCFHRPEIYNGIYQKESSFLLQSFFGLLRK